ncbi:hypothetical protein ZYGR_0A01390 [Zygosaccharomyces rouxii]|uniref:ZYRO0A03146p n=2 Tax=Zygosaccharomyces rouxii TaxID=4956 RepID=C5DPG3_ZYGRC|nr:uncharacterized protein ZYRO0A03146g [Zygosaccharomyces rouxii]KAH9198905.1 hypothetical protein LQ764DRAFT_143750 [Zygosaccharomyces rouxii]GAV46547.1 hypothetical protein ZYGR_0A01390 [Zygosaccharomyces rouxii]CAR25574.1 ZYRO0A03146p [Zygosaccharomyces rouxii]
MQVSKQDYSKVEPFVAVPDAVLSEGIVYVSPARTLLWVDIYRAKVYRRRMDTGVTDVFHADGSGSIGAVFPILKRSSSDGNDTQVEEFLFAAKEGIAHGQFGGSWKYVVKYSESGLDSERLKRLRSNDGNVHGEDLYIGLINDFDQETTDEGVIFKINLVSKKIDVFWPRISIPNSLYWVGEYMFVTDSMNSCIWRTKHGFQEREKFIDVTQYSTDPEGNLPEPDGSCLSSNGELLFVSIWGHSKVQVFSTKDGALLQEILLPEETPRVSCCAVVGSDLFVTTGSEHLGTSKVGQPSKGGCLYRLSDVIPESDEFSTRGIIYRDD